MKKKKGLLFNFLGKLPINSVREALRLSALAGPAGRKEEERKIIPFGKRLSFPVLFSFILHECWTQPRPWSCS